jgi:hypothetical protein
MDPPKQQISSSWEENEVQGILSPGQRFNLVAQAKFQVPTALMQVPCSKNAT